MRSPTRTRRSGTWTPTAWRARRSSWSTETPGLLEEEMPVIGVVRGRLRSDLHGGELGRVVLLEREALLEHAQIEQRVLHEAEGVQIEAAIHRQQRAHELVRAPGRRLRPADPLGCDADALVGVVPDEPGALEHPAHRLHERLPLALDDLVGGVGHETDPLGRDLVEPHQDAADALDLDHGAGVPEDEAL